MQLAQCKLCHEVRPLRRSHVIPAAVFRRLFRENQGKAITFCDEVSSWIEYSSESWWERLLCDECESRLNRHYEQYSILVLRNSIKSVVVYKAETGVSFTSVDAIRFQLFIASIMWRAAVSSLPVYSKVCLPPPWEAEVRDCLLNRRKVRGSLMSVKISRLIDKSSGGFSFDVLKSLVISPYFRIQRGCFSFCFLVEGFFIEVFVPGLKIRERNRLGMVRASQNTVFANYLDIFDVPELVKLLVSGYGKHVEGRSKIKR